MAFVPNPTSYVLGDTIILKLNTTSGESTSSIAVEFYIVVNNSSILVGTARDLGITTLLSNTAISAILNVSKSSNVSTSTSWATWYAIVNGTTQTSTAQIEVTIPSNTYYPKLSATPTFKDTLSTTKTLTGNEAKIVLNASTLSVTGTIINNTATVTDPTTITNWTVTIGTRSVGGSGSSISASITKPTSVTVKITITNGRGVTKVYTYTLPNYVNYKVPTASITSLTRSTSDLTKAIVKYTISMFTGSFGATTNTATITTKSGILSNGTVSTWTTVDTKTSFSGTSYSKTLSNYTEEQEYGFKGTFQDKLNTINVSQVNLPVALPVLAFSPDSADLFGTFHLHNRNSAITRYLAIHESQSASAIQHRNVDNDSNVNYIYLYDDRLVTKGDVVADGVYLLDSLFYASGDTLAINPTNDNPTNPYTAYVTSSTKVIRVTIPVGKSLQRISTIQVTQMIGAIIGPSGYVNIPSATDVGSHATDWKVSGVTITATKRDNYTISVQVTGSSAFYNATNNRPMIYAPSNGGIVFTLT